MGDRDTDVGGGTWIFAEVRSSSFFQGVGLAIFLVGRDESDISGWNPNWSWTIMWEDASKAPPSS